MPIVNSRASPRRCSIAANSAVSALDGAVGDEDDLPQVARHRRLRERHRRSRRRSPCRRRRPKPVDEARALAHTSSVRTTLRPGVQARRRRVELDDVETIAAASSRPSASLSAAFGLHDRLPAHRARACRSRRSARAAASGRCARRRRQDHQQRIGRVADGLGQRRDRPARRRLAAATRSRGRGPSARAAPPYRARTARPAAAARARPRRRRRSRIAPPSRGAVHAGPRCERSAARGCGCRATRVACRARAPRGRTLRATGCCARRFVVPEGGRRPPFRASPAVGQHRRASAR